MKLIDRYVAEVGKRLPLVKGRKDIEKELRSTLEDMLEDRAQKSGGAANEAMEIELLKEYGSPQQVAETYNPTPYLIGPRMFPTFILVLKIVIGAVTLAMTIVAAIQIMSLSPITFKEVFKVIGEGLLNILTASVGAFGNVALVFALIERFAPSADIKLGEDEIWEPETLMKEPEPEEFKSWEPILAIVFTFIAISIFNFNPEWLSISYNNDNMWFIGFGDFMGDKKGSIPLLSEAFFRWLPLMNIGWVAEIILNGLLLRTGRWDTPSRLFSMGIKLFQIVILGLLISGPSILALTPEALRAGGITDIELIQILDILTRQGIKVILGLAIFGSVVEIIKSGYKLITQSAAK
jgi:hypothetical protein